MSEQTQNTPSAPCDALLDYAYGELEGAAKEAFERHLAECEKCKRELEALGKVRGAARAALPLLEPPANATSALHAQLLHAAAQRKPATRGKLLTFPRRVMQHPGWLAAASLLVIGGALGLNWSKGHLFMPTPTMERTPAMADKPAQAVPAAPSPKPAAAPAMTAAPAGETTTDETVSKTATKSLAKDKNADNEKIMLDLPKQPPMKVRRAAPAEPEFKAAPAKNGLADDLDVRAPADSFGAVGGAGGAAKKETPAARGRLSEGAAGQGDVMNYATDGKAGDKAKEEAPAPYRDPAPAAAAPAPKPAPPPPPATRSQMQTVQPNASTGYATPPAAKQQKADSWSPPSQNERQAAPEPQAAESLQQAAPAHKHAGKKSAPARDDNGLAASDDARKAFLEAAKSNNCAEVIRIYSDQTRTKRVWATPDEDAEFTRCVSQARREQQSIDNAEQKRSKAKKAGKPAAADAPAQAAPASKAAY